MEYEPGLAALTARVGGAGTGPGGRGHDRAEIRVVHGSEDLHTTVINTVNVDGEVDCKKSSLGFWSVGLGNNLEEENHRNKVKFLQIKYLTSL